MVQSIIGSGPVLLDLDELGIARVRLNRPEASNGMDVPFLRALYDALIVAHGLGDLRVLVISGEGKNFCAGGDVKDLASKGEDLPNYLREATSWLQICVQAMLALEAPVIASVHGFAAGGGGSGTADARDGLAAVIERRAPVFTGK